MERKATKGPRPWPQRPCLLPTRRTVLGCGTALAAQPSPVPGAWDGIRPCSVLWGWKWRDAGPSFRGGELSLSSCQMCLRGGFWLWVENQVLS